MTIVATLLMVERALAAAEALAAEGIERGGHRPALGAPARHARPSGRRSSKTGRLVVAEEQWHEGGWGATLISRAGAGGRRRGRRRRAAVSLPDDLLIPYSPPLEDEIIPSADRIASAARATAGR